MAVGPLKWFTFAFFLSLFKYFDRFWHWPSQFHQNSNSFPTSAGQQASPYSRRNFKKISEKKTWVWDQCYFFSNQKRNWLNTSLEKNYNTSQSFNEYDWEEAKILADHWSLFSEMKNTNESCSPMLENKIQIPKWREEKNYVLNYYIYYDVTLKNQNRYKR